MVHISDAILQSAVDAIPEGRFDSHRVIRQVMRIRPQEYVRELYERVSQKDPIRSTNAEIGKALAQLGTIKKLDKIQSSNVRSEPSEDTDNQAWERL